jgi:hypothetical protein
MGTKIQLSAAEMNLLCDAEIILTKNAILEKTWALLQQAQEAMIDHANAKGFLKSLPAFSIPPKISKGENYQGLPYLILDYPRHFKQDETFAIRSFFWWGHFFSSTLQLSGSYKQKGFQNVAAAYSLLAPNHYLCINNDPWQHHFDKSNYKKIGEMTEPEFAARLQELDHIKIAAKWPLNEWHSAAMLLLQNFKFLLQVYCA